MRDEETEGEVGAGGEREKGRKADRGPSLMLFEFPLPVQPVFNMGQLISLFAKTS